MEKIAFVQTGGTIDKDYPATETTHGYNFEVGNPVFEEVLQRIKPVFEWAGYSLLKKDSLEQRVYDGVSALEEKKVVITHGTDTIFKTAEKLSALRNKIIVLTGAMLPGKFSASDAMFNLGMAAGSIQAMEKPGVFIALYGRVVPWEEYPELLKEAGR